VRNWYARNPDIVDTENRLVDNAWSCAAAFERGKIFILVLLLLLAFATAT